MALLLPHPHPRGPLGLSPLPQWLSDGTGMGQGPGDRTTLAGPPWEGRRPCVDTLARSFQRLSSPAGLSQTPVLSPGSLPLTDPATALWENLLSLRSAPLDSACLVATTHLGHVMGQVLSRRPQAQQCPRPGVSLFFQGVWSVSPRPPVLVRRGCLPPVAVTSPMGALAALGSASADTTEFSLSFLPRRGQRPLRPLPAGRSLSCLTGVSMPR